jgi:hypothetical protein
VAQLSLFADDDSLRRRLRALDINQLTPLQALNELQALKGLVS